MTTSSKINTFKNASFGKDLHVLNDIHLNEINIAIYQRTIEIPEEEIMYFLNQGLQLKAQGRPKNIIETFKSDFLEKGFSDSSLLRDCSNLLHFFEESSNATEFRVLISSVETDMCSRFHTDVNKLRLLCTYHGPATLWLPEAAEDRAAYHSGEENQKIIKNPALIQQAQTGEVLLLKGALYPNAQAVMHRSPSIQKKGEKRLLLRIDLQK